MTDPVTIEKKDGNLLIGNFSEQGLNYEESRVAYEQVVGEVASGAGGISCDLSGVKHTNYTVITFLIACGQLCAEKSLSICLSGIENDDLKKALAALGFKDGQFTQKEFRAESPTSIFISFGESACVMWEDTKKLVGFIGETFIAVLYLFKHPRKLNVKEVLFYMDKSGADAVPIVTMICFLVGLILAFQGIAQMARFGLQIYVADLVALALVRELGPLMVAMICIGRAGSAFAAELGTMKVNEEIDAMNTMGLKPARFLVIPKMIALIICMPLLVIIGDISGILGGVSIGVGMTDLSLIEYWNRTLDSLIPANIVESLVKAFAFAFIIATVGCFRGFEADNDAKGVGKATTSSVVSGIFLVVIADFLVTFTIPNVMALFGIDY